MAPITEENGVDIQLLGQSGCKLGFSNLNVYLDPYLSNSVQELDAPDLPRLKPVPFAPEQVVDADWTLLTHAHIDHCDPKTVPQLAASSPGCQFIGPSPVLEILRVWGIEADRLHLATESWQVLAGDLRIHAIPAAHPEIERDGTGQLAAVGYLLERKGKRIYLAGDTSIVQELIDALLVHRPIEAAFLPVNEQNFFRDRRGIIGNMSIREAFLLAEEIEVRQVVPVHWDMFAANSAYPEEIQIIYKHMGPRFELIMEPLRLSL